MIENLVGLITVVMGASIMRLARHAKTRKLAWRLGVLNQFVWGAVAFTTGVYTLVFGCLLYGWVYINNLRKGD